MTVCSHPVNLLPKYIYFFIKLKKLKLCLNHYYFIIPLPMLHKHFHGFVYVIKKGHIEVGLLIASHVELMSGIKLFSQHIFIKQ